MHRCELEIVPQSDDSEQAIELGGIAACPRSLQTFRPAARSRARHLCQGQFCALAVAGQMAAAIYTKPLRVSSIRFLSARHEGQVSTVL